jgi:hypothetical protein
MPQSPLYDIFDPTGELSWRAQASGRTPTLEDLMPEEERKSRLRELANMGANGISGLGWILDTPGSMMRGLLSGGPSKAVSALWDDSEDRVTGRELLQQYGMAGEENTWGNFAGGLAAEILLDPLSWVGPGLLGKGAKTTAGGLAGRAGLLEGADVAARQVNKGIRQHLRESTPRSLIDNAPDPLRAGMENQFLELAKHEASRPPTYLERLTRQTTRPSVDDLLDMPVTRTNRLSVLGRNVGATDLYGKEAGDWLAKTADDIGENAKQLPYIGPAYRMSQAVLDRNVNRNLGYEEQWRARKDSFDKSVRTKAMKASLGPRVYDAVEGQRAAARTWAEDYAQQKAQLSQREAALNQTLQAAPSPMAAQAIQKQLDDVAAEVAYLDRIQAAGGPIGVNTPEYGVAMRHAIENPDLGRLPPIKRGGTLTPEEALRQARLEAAQDLFDETRPGYQTTPHAALIKYAMDSKQGASDVAKILGVPLNEFESRAGTGWFPRQQLWFENLMQPKWPAGVKAPTPREQQRVAGGLQVSPLGDAYSKSRTEHMDLLGGSAVVDRMSTDAALQDALRNATDDDVPQIVESWFQSNFPEWISAAQSKNPRSKVSELYPWADEVDPKTGQYRHSPNFELDPKPGSAAEALLSSQSAKEAALGALPSGNELNKRLASATDRLANLPLVLSPNILQHRTNVLNAAIANAQKKLGDRSVLESDLLGLSGQIQSATRRQYADTLNVQLADVLRRLDPQHASTGLPMFGQHPLDELLNYNTSRAHIHSNARNLLDDLKKIADPRLPDAVPGGANYSWEEAAQKLGFDPERFVQAIKTHNNLDAEFVSFPKVDIDNWAKALAAPSGYSELSPALQAFDNYTKRFKTLALFSPSRWVRDRTSGAFAANMKGLYSWNDRSAGEAMARGDYGPLAKQLDGAIGYRGMSPEERVRKFMRGAAEQDMATTGVVSETASGAPSASMREIYPGSTAPVSRSGSLLDFLTKDVVVGKDVPLIQRFNPYSIRTSAGNKNPLLEFGDRVSESTDAANRYGTYLTAIRKGYHPAEARRLSDMTQVNYRPEAFTDFERNVIKRGVPFYSYQKGIIPLVADEVLNHPAGDLGNAVRVMTRASEPNEEFFVPEYLRQSSSFPIHNSMPLIGLGEGSAMQRFVTHVDLPFEGLINTITPGTGNSLLDKLSSGVYKTGQNLLGMTHPLLKGPAELLTDRQFHSGRQLSDLYSILEANTGMPSSRWIEHLAVNAPGGSKALGALRQITDDRLTPFQKLTKYGFKTATGTSLTDVEMKRTQRLASRNMLNDLLQKTPGVRTYENITVPDEQLRLMPPEQQRMYLLYKIIQAQAAKESRQQKKALQDPMQMLGVD